MIGSCVCSSEIYDTVYVSVSVSVCEKREERGESRNMKLELM